MKRGIAICFACAIFGALGVSSLLMRTPAQTIEPLSASDGSSDIASLPAGSIVLTMKDNAQITAPFRLGEDSAAVGGVAMLLPKGMGTKERSGVAKLEAEAPEAGTYFAWARVLWRDSCSNSITLKVNDSAEKTVGEDSLYNAWHWVPAGEYKLVQGKNAVLLQERENGIALDELLFTREKKYTPLGMINTLGEMRGIRRFADDFARSPGHGMEAWDLVSGKWNIAFSFDPNRIPNQYALDGQCGQCADLKNGNVQTQKSGTGVPPVSSRTDGLTHGQDARATDGPAIALVKGSPWYGCRMDFSFYPTEEGKYGTVLDRSMDGKDALLVSFHLGENRAEVVADGLGIHESAELNDAMRLQQWHHVVVERWAWILRVFVDDKLVLSSFNAAPRAGAVGFFVASGKATFDDLEIEEIAWQADNNADQSITWQTATGAQWFRETDNQVQPPAKTLVGRTGTLSTKLGDMPLEEVVIEEQPQPKGKIQVTAEGLSPAAGAANITVLRRDELSKTPACKSLTLKVDGEEAHLSRVAVRYGERSRQKYSVGPYNFAEAEIEDPSDYLDFTPEEYKQMQQSPERGKLERQAKFKPLVGDWGEAESPWLRERGHWMVNNGVLMASGPASLRHAEEATSDMELHFRVRLNDPRAVAEVELYSMPDPGVRVQIAGEKAVVPAQFGDAHVAIKASAGNEFHDIIVRADGGHVTVKFDKDPPREANFKKGDGGRLVLKAIYGRVDFDDILCEYPKRTAHGAIYSFQRRENDWWREGAWIDHGGISCVLASSWVSLVSPKGEGMIWNKRPISSNALIAFDVEENTEWFGWDRYPSHTHYPYDNIRAEFAGANGSYRMVVNADNRSATILYRNGAEVARVRQDGRFPFHFLSLHSHAPYSPRRNRICLVKRGDLIRGIVDGKEVLSYKDPSPLEINRAGLGGSETHINFSHIELRDLDLTEPTGEKKK